MKISIITPTYNCSSLLKKAIDSVINQTYSDWELIIIDNSSTDDTNEVISSFNNEKIKKLTINNNGVIAASRNMGILNAKGEWIAFLDSDDIWYPNKLHECIAAISLNHSIDVVSTNEFLVDIVKNKKVPLKYGPYTNEFYKDLLINGNKLSTSATMVKRKFLSENNLLFSINQNYITVEDYNFWLQLAKIDAKFFFINSFQGEYIIHGENSSLKLETHWRHLENLLHDHVFNLNYEIRKKIKIWSYIQGRLIFMKFKYKFINIGKLNALKYLIFEFFSKPFPMFRFVFIKLFNKI